MDEFYLQDSRGFVGNDMLFWALSGGYTTDVSRAELFSKERAVSLNRQRDTDIPWPKDYIDGKTRPAVDVQYTDIKEALKGVGFKLHKDKPYPKRKCRCYHCGIFISESQCYGPCPKCGEDNRP